MDWSYVVDISNERKGIHQILRLNSVYNFVQNLLGGRASTKLLVEIFIQPGSGATVVGVGSGPGSLFNYLNLVDGVTYTGIEPNADYTSLCKVDFKEFPNANFYTGSIEIVDSLNEEFDVIIVFAVLHHLNLDSWPTVLESLYGKLKKGGRLLLLDSILHDKQNLISKILIKLDRGQSILHEVEYKRVIQSSGYSFDSIIKTDLLRVPYSHILTTIKK
jgi:SAM-dependent methyltransferase